MFAQMTLEQKLVSATVIGFAVVGVLSFLLLTADATLPGEPPLNKIQNGLESIRDNTQQGGRDGEAQLVKEFGEKPVFSALIPLPTPTPRPTPTPVPDPSLEEAIASWKVSGVIKGMVFLNDPRKNEEWFMDEDQPDTLSKPVKHKNVDMIVKLKTIDDVNLNATFLFEGINGPAQQVTKGMFDE